MGGLGKFGESMGTIHCWGRAAQGIGCGVCNPLPLGGRFVARICSQQVPLPESLPLLLSQYFAILKLSLFPLFCICVEALKKNLPFMLFIISKYQS